MIDIKKQNEEKTISLKLSFSMKNGQVLDHRLLVKKNDKDEFIHGLLSQITTSTNNWFVINDKDNNHSICLCVKEINYLETTEVD